VELKAWVFPVTYDLQTGFEKAGTRMEIGRRGGGQGEAMKGRASKHKAVKLGAVTTYTVSRYR